mmetsp:Transcript_20922/g.47210  ORF Transcript_20922/g.47210 Transcript_20922/m.47210 type:complete len:98 (+) Transcript_20922:1099-1392(+)
MCIRLPRECFIPLFLNSLQGNIRRLQLRKQVQPRGRQDNSLLFPHNLPLPARSTSTTSSLPFQASLAMSLTFPAGHQLPNLSATAQAISSHGPQQGV